MSVVVEKELPKGWARIILEQLSDKITDGEHLKPKFLSNGIPFISAKDITEHGVNFEEVKFVSKSDADVFRKKCNPDLDDILMVSRGNVGKVCINNSEQEFCLLGSVILIKTSFNFLSKFLLYFLKSITTQNKLIKLSSSTVQGAIYLRDIKNLDIPLPPLNEQKRIVAKIEELFSLVDSAKDTLEKTKVLLKQYRQSILKHAFEGKLVPQDPNDEPASVLLEKIKKENPEKKFSEIVSEKELPKGWINTTVGMIGNVITGNTPSKKNQKYFGEDIPFLKPTDLNAGYYVFDSKEKLSFEGGKRSRLIPEKSILVTCIGATIGKTGMNRIECSTNQQINSIIPNQVICFPEYIYFYFISTSAQKSIISNSSSTTLPIINKSKFSKLILPLPPIKEQKRIVTKIEESFSLIEKNEILIDQLLLQYKQIKNSILKQAFEGKLVPQDPNDEPAEVLLQRIKEEKKK